MKDFALITVPRLESISPEQLKGISELIGMPILFLERGMEFKVGDVAREELLRIKEKIDSFLS